MDIETEEDLDMNKEVREAFDDLHEQIQRRSDETSKKLSDVHTAVAAVNRRLDHHLLEAEPMKFQLQQIVEERANFRKWLWRVAAGVLSGAVLAFAGWLVGRMVT